MDTRRSAARELVSGILITSVYIELLSSMEWMFKNYVRLCAYVIVDNYN